MRRENWLECIGIDVPQACRNSFRLNENKHVPGVPDHWGDCNFSHKFSVGCLNLPCLSDAAAARSPLWKWVCEPKDSWKLAGPPSWPGSLHGKSWTCQVLLNARTSPAQIHILKADCSAAARLTMGGFFASTTWVRASNWPVGNTLIIKNLASLASLAFEKSFTKLFISNYVEYSLLSPWFTTMTLLQACSLQQVLMPPVLSITITIIQTNRIICITK